MKKIKAAAAVVMAVVTLFMTGCENYRELESLLIVAGIGIDRGRAGEKYHLSFDVVDMLGASSGGASPKTMVIDSDGATIFDAVRNIVKISGKRLYFSDCKAVVFSSEIAQRGILPVTEFFSRDAEVRRTTDLLVAKNCSAKEILEGVTIADPINSFEIDKLLQGDDRSLGKAPYISLFESNNMLDCNGISLILPAIVSAQKENQKTAKLDGTAIFLEDRLQGFIGPEESKYLLILKNDIKGGLLVVGIPDEENGIVLEILRSETTIRPECTGGTLKMKILVDIKAALAEDETNEDYSQVKMLKKAEEMAEETIRQHVKSIISQAQNQYDNDIFGFGNIVYKTNKKKWDALSPEWRETFRKLGYDLDVKVTIENTATRKSKAKGSA